MAKKPREADVVKITNKGKKELEKVNQPIQVKVTEKGKEVLKK